MPGNMSRPTLAKAEQIWSTMLNTTSIDISQIIDKHSGLLSCSSQEDAFLSEMRQKASSHAFLAHSTQAVYTRQINFLSAILKDYVDREPNDIKVLDWGCGKGHITYLLNTRGFDVTSCDIHKKDSDSTFGQETPIIDKLGISVVSLEHRSKLPFASGSFDCVVSFGVLEHVYSDRESLSELRRILKVGGLLFVTFLPYCLSWTQAIARVRGNHYHDRLYNIKGFKRLVADSGFRIHRVALAQLFPKNSIPLSLDKTLEPIDRFLCSYSPLKYVATNIEAILEPC